MNYSVFLRIFLILFLASIFSHSCYSQKTEIRANAYSGMFFFRGNGSTSTSPVVISDVGYFNSVPYGRKSGFSFSLELQIQRVTKQKHLFGMGISFEKLKSRANIDSAWTDIGKYPETGRVILSNTFITINPYIGQRFIANKYIFDILAGIDFSFGTKVDETAKIKSAGDFTNSLHKTNHPDDLRPRIQINAYHKRIGLLAGYSLGLKNLYFYGNPNYLNKKAYTNFLRVGLSYRLT